MEIFCKLLHYLLTKFLENIGTCLGKNPHMSYIHPIRNDIYETSPALSFDRKHQVVLTRMKIGHTNLTRVYLLGKKKQPMCNSCQTINSIEHIITSCRKYQRERRLYQINGNPWEVSGTVNSRSRVLKFLKHIKIFHLL